MKKVLSLFLAVVMIMSVFSIVPFEVGAAQTDVVMTGYTNCEFVSGDYVCMGFSDGTATISYRGSAKNLDIPSTLNGYKVTSINSFSYCSSLTSVTIPDGVTSILSDAFSHCENLTSVTIPDSVTSIGDSAFSNCSSLTSIKIPNGITSIAYSMFYYCESLVSIIIPDSVTSIGYMSFYLCTSLTSITIPDSVTSIDPSAFGGCLSLKSITIPDSVTSIGYGAFQYCDNLASIEIYNKNCEIESRSIPENATIYCVEGSTAENYAKTKGIDYEYFCKNGHTEVLDKGYAPTYGKDGLTDGSHCSVCKEVLVKQEVIPRLGLLGDLDDDGEVSVMDATAIQLHIAQLDLLSDERLECGDTDKDGEVSIMDATQIQLFIAQLIPEL